VSLNQTLKHLFPIDLSGVHQADIEHDARLLSAAQGRAETLLVEMFANGADELLPDWERVLGLIPGSDDPLQVRRDGAVRKIREQGGLSRYYFIGLAAAMGYTVEIEEPVPSMADWLAASDELMPQEIEHQWGVAISGQPLYEFRAGESVAGERLLWWSSQSILEGIFLSLKPAHTAVYFNYED
jgi:uncharacterized protein YmfQ (DUF2313 family)